MYSLLAVCMILFTINLQQQTYLSTILKHCTTHHLVPSLLHRAECPVQGVDALLPVARLTGNLRPQKVQLIQAQTLE